MRRYREELEFLERTPEEKSSDLKYWSQAVKAKKGYAKFKRREVQFRERLQERERLRKVYLQRRIAEVR
jgi:hypothetical protein